MMGFDRPGDSSAAISAEAVRRLTDAQRDCLRLVYQHKTSKEIAPLLGISRHTADQRLERACRILGVDGRVKAAIILARHEAISDQVIYEPVVIARSPVPLPVEDIPVDECFSEDMGVSQDLAVYGPMPREADSVWRTLAPGGKPDDLTPAARIKWIVQLMVQIVIALLVLLAIAEAASAIAERTWPFSKFSNS